MTDHLNGSWEIYQQQVRPALRCVDVFSADEVKLHKSGGRGLRGPCPIHGGDNPESLSVNPDTLEWRCQACDASGGAIEWVMAVRGVTKEEARDQLARMVGVDLHPIPPIPKKGNGAAGQSERDTALRRAFEAWCAQRFLDPDLLLGGWGGRLVSVGQRAAFRFPTSLEVDRLRFLDGAQPKTKWAKQGEGRAHWYGLAGALVLLESGQCGGILYLVNGEPSVWACQQSKVPAVCTCGESVLPTPKDFHHLCEALAAHQAKVAVIYDLDRAGRSGAWKMLAALRAEGIDAIALELPADLGRKGDVDDLHRKVGDQGLPSALLALVELPAKGASLVHDWLADAPVPPTASVPDGWQISAAGVGRLKYDQSGEPEVELVTRAPMLIAGRLVDVGDGGESMRLVWRRNNAWREQVVERSICLDSRKLVQLAQVGAPVNSNQTKLIVAFLDAYEAQNLQRLDCSTVSKQLGWQGEGGADGFLWGTDHIQPVGTVKEPIRFHAIDSGEAQIASGFVAGGTRAGWLKAIEPLRHYPRVALALYASLVPPLLPIIGAPNFVVDWSYTTSTGKTTTLRVGASVWGNPDERGAASTMFSWDTTRVWVERASAVLNCLPLILDDTKRAKKPEDIAAVLYAAANGRGRGRGSPTGMRRSGTWTTVVLSSGEQPATSFTQDGGTRGRVLTVWGLPFIDSEPDTATVVHRLNAELRQHHGWLGPEFVRYLMAHRDQWDAWRASYLEIESAYLEAAQGRAVAGRIAGYMAAVAVAEQLVHEAVRDLPFARLDVITRLGNDIMEEASEGDRVRGAIEHVLSWAAGHRGEFLGHEGTGDEQHPCSSGWAGRWDSGRLCFLPHRLDEILERAGFNPTASYRAWKDRGWIVADTDCNRFRKRIRMSSVDDRVWAIVIDPEVVEGGEEERPVVPLRAVPTRPRAVSTKEAESPAEPQPVKRHPNVF